MYTLTAQLDRIENALPPVPARVVRLQRTVAGSTYDQFAGAVQTVMGATRTVLGVAQISGRTVTGQTKAASRDLLANATRNANQVIGQTRAQARRVSTTAKDQVTDVIDAAIDAVEPAVDAVDQAPGSGTPYEQWSKSELLERAQEVGVKGRSSLSKQELIAALRTA